MEHIDRWTLLVLGDSISASYGLELTQGWVAGLERALRETYSDCTVINASVFGATTADGLKLLPELLEKYRPNLIVVELGGNDVLRASPLPSLKENLSRLVDTSQQGGALVVLAPAEALGEHGGRYAAGVRKVFREIAESFSCVLAPFILENVYREPDLMQDDGIHPNAAAQAQMVQTMLPSIFSAMDGRT
ncbi:arylesterase [Candidatus Marimicrobium litorale]|uniref:Arylesterase n=1 Tax=Candidatus Marimicrobium litorale TaxID=2518991 RepID=A0ABT3T9A2_9GAMM|nr:arylesterase [Candidatus Marimicrobium litorale]MCX2978863.1 arylesterase [Candidatus Marimicrobium litorale]